MIHFFCPACQTTLLIEDEHAGKYGECYVCKCVFLAPLASTITPERQLLPEVYAAQSPQPDPNALPYVAVPATELASLANNCGQLLRVGTAICGQLVRQFEAIERNHKVRDRQLGDLTAQLMKRAPYAVEPPVRLRTDFPVALESVDHNHPRGVRDDNTHWPRFVGACERHFRRPLRFLDLGCAGGGVVLDFLVRGHCGVGLEGSDYALRNMRAEWRTIPHNLFTCDISRPFELLDAQTGEPFKADVISMWEVLEHIPSDRLPALFKNVRDHLADDGLFVGSVATFADDYQGVQYHVTLEPRAWWEEALRENGLAVTNEPIFDRYDFCRGIGRDASDSSYYDETFDRTGIAQHRSGFHVVARRGVLGPAAGTVPPAQGVPDYSP